MDDELTAANARIAELQAWLEAETSLRQLAETRIAALESLLGEALESLERHIPEGHGPHPNPEYEIVERARKCFQSRT